MNTLDLIVVANQIETEAQNLAVYMNGDGVVNTLDLAAVEMILPENDSRSTGTFIC